MPEPLPLDHPTFGPCITVRRKGIPDWIIYGILMVLLTFFGLFMIIEGMVMLFSPDLLAGLILTSLGLAFLFLVWLCILTLVRVVEFYHEGAVDRILSRRREFPYAACIELTYSLTARYAEGIPSGTTLGLKLKSSDGRTLRFSGIHRDPPKRLAITLSGRTFASEEELDVVRDIIASHVAQSLASQLHSHGSVPWTRRAAISSEGVTPSSGWRKRTLIRWSAFHHLATPHGSIELFERGEEEPVATLFVNAKNFYPGLALAQSLMPTREAESPPSVP